MQFDENTYQKVLTETFKNNKDISPRHLSLIKNVSDIGAYKYVGSVYCRKTQGEDVCVNINTGAHEILLYYPHSRTTEYIGNLDKVYYSYSGGCFFQENGCVYGFPRHSNFLLKIDINRKTVEEIDVGFDHFHTDDKKIICGHHYGGVLYKDKIILPPRLLNYIYILDLKNKSLKKVSHSRFRSNHYNGAILHSNGKVYFTPWKGGTVAEFDPETEDISFFGDALPVALYGGVVYIDGCIYSFSRDKGLYRIDPSAGVVELVADKTIENNPIGGCYGTVLHFNGKIYNIQGDGYFFYEYDPEKESCRTIATFEDGRYNQAKWAGGSLMANGNIYLTPAFGRFAAEITFSREPVISDEMRELLYSSYFHIL